MRLERAAAGLAATRTQAAANPWRFDPAGLTLGILPAQTPRRGRIL